MTNLNPDILAELNGSVFLHNECGEAEQDTNIYHVIVGTDTPGSQDTRFFSQDPTNGSGAPTDPIPMNGAQSKQFLTDQFFWMRVTCGLPVGTHPDQVLYELCYLKYLAYRHRLSVGNINLQQFFVRYNDVRISDPAQQGTVLHAIRNAPNYAQTANAVAGWFNANIATVRNLTKYFSNLVCTVAYVFRQLGHHYINSPTYDDTYRRIWSKVTGGGIEAIAVSSWEMIATIGLHSIIPSVLDGYWTYCVNQGRCAAPLVLRHSVPCAGTAAPFALLVGWCDARSIYGALLKDAEGTFDDLEDLVDTLKANRWAHGINAQYYGANPRRLYLISTGVGQADCRFSCCLSNDWTCC